jgi:nucleotide-binding universal stress UspA family protein
MPTAPRPPTISRIEVAVDLAPVSQRAARYARMLLRPGMSLKVVSAVDDPRVLLPDLPAIDALLAATRNELTHDAQAAIDRAATAFAGSGVPVDTQIADASTSGGSAADALVADAAEWQADLLVLGAHSRHVLLRLVERAVSDAIERCVRCALLIVPDRYDRPIASPPRRMMFAVDGSGPSMCAARVGLQLATPTTLLYAAYAVDRTVHLLDVVSARALEDAYRAQGGSALADARALFAYLDNPSKRGMLDTQTAGDDVAHALMREAVHWQADLLVAGTHARRGVAAAALGSIARRIAQIAEVPVLLVRESA